MYQVHSVTIQKEDREKADAILYSHQYDYDDIREDGSVDSQGNCTITYWIKPYIYEDFETIVNEFKENGIRVM